MIFSRVFDLQRYVLKKLHLNMTDSAICIHFSQKTQRSFYSLYIVINFAD